MEIFPKRRNEISNVGIWIVLEYDNLCRCIAFSLGSRKNDQSGLGRTSSLTPDSYESRDLCGYVPGMRDRSI